MSPDDKAGFVVDEKRFRRFSQKNDIYCRSFWDSEVHSEKSEIFYETYRNTICIRVCPYNKD